MPNYRCIFPSCRFNKRVTYSDSSFFHKHLEDNHFDKISSIALGTSTEFKEVVLLLEEKSQVRSLS